MKPMLKQLSKRRPPWAGVLLHGGVVLVLAVLALVPSHRVPNAQAQGTLTITSNTGTYVVLDSNDQTAGPSVFTAAAEVCNTGDEPLTDVVVNIGNGSAPGVFPTTTFGGIGYFLQTLDEVVNGDTSDATRSLGTIAAGECVWVYWQLVYPTPATPDLDGLVLDFTVWGTAAGGITGSVVDDVELHSMISAAANKTNPDTYTLSPTGPSSIGQQVELCYTDVNFGTIGNGPGGVNDFWFQPVGTTAFDPDVLQLVGTTASLVSSKCTGPPQPIYSFEDITYFTNIDGGDWDGDGVPECSGNSQQITGEYCYTFVAIAPGTSTIQPYQEASSGNQQKYNSDYTGTTIDIQTDDTCSVSLAKSADKDNVLQDEELTYSTQFTNLLDAAVGAPPGTTLQILDAIPSNTTYKVGSASCTGGTVYYSINDGTDYTSTEPASVPSLVTNLKCVLDDALAAAPGSGTFSYTVIAQDSNGVTAAPATSNFSGAQCSASQGVSTTPVTLSYFLASRSGETVRFEWSTATETGNVGFNLYAVGPGGRQRANPELIPSHVVDSLEPQDYVFEAAGVDGDRFFIEDVDLFGRTRQHGPFLIGEANGARVVPEPIDWAAIRAEHEAKAEARTAKAVPRPSEGQATAQQEDGAGRSASASFVAASGPIQLLIERDGLYRVTYEALLAAGFDLAGAKAADLALTNRGLPVPTYVQSGGPKFGPGAYVEFYGQALDTLYTRTNVYILEVNRASAQQAAVDSTLPSDSAPLEPFYMETVAVEHNGQYSNSSPSDDPWYERRLFALSGPVEASFGLPVDQYVGDTAPSTLFVGVWGMIDWPRAPDHHLMASLNETIVADEWFDGITNHPFSLSVPAGVLHEGLNTLKLRLPWDTGSQYDMVAVDNYSVAYPRAFVARDGVLTFQAAGGRFRVEALPEASAVVYRLDDDGLAKLTQLQIDGTSGAYSVTFAGSGTDAKYLVSTEAALLAPAIEAGRPPTDITSGTASYILIAHPDFVDGLAPLVDARQAQGYTVRVVNVEDVYAQFGHGIFDAQAIRDYITYAANQMGTQYFLLVGGDTYDYRDYLGVGAMSFIPSLYAPTGPWVSFAPVDPLYTDLDSNGMPDRAIGRFPVRSAAELDVLVSKTLAYASKDYGATAVFAADAFDGQRSYADDSALFIQQLPQDWTVQEAYIDEVGLANARTTLIDAMNSGIALTNFVGHSATREWTFGGLFTMDDALDLTNVGRPTLVSQYGCWNNWYVATYDETLAHRLLVSGLQGAAATLGPSTLADSASEAALGQHLTSRLVEPGMTLGAAIQAAKADLASTGEGTADMLLGWVLLGDPTLVVQP